MVRRLAPLLLTLPLLSCGEDVTIGGPDEPVPGQTLPVDVSIPSGLPTGGAGPFFRSGMADVKVGDSEASLELGQTVPSTFAAGVLSVSYGDATSGSFLNIAGQVHSGENQTGPGLSLSVGDGNTLLTALGDECTVDFETLSPEGVGGSFSCRGLSAPGGDVDASGTFTAEP